MNKKKQVTGKEFEPKGDWQFDEEWALKKLDEKGIVKGKGKGSEGTAQGQELKGGKGSQPGEGAGQGQKLKGRQGTKPGKGAGQGQTVKGEERSKQEETAGQEGLKGGKGSQAAGQGKEVKGGEGTQRGKGAGHGQQGLFSWDWPIPSTVDKGFVFVRSAPSWCNRGCSAGIRGPALSLTDPCQAHFGSSTSSDGSDNKRNKGKCL